MSFAELHGIRLLILHKLLPPMLPIFKRRYDERVTRLLSTDTNGGFQGQATPAASFTLSWEDRIQITRTNICNNPLFLYPLITPGSNSFVPCTYMDTTTRPKGMERSSMTTSEFHCPIWFSGGGADLRRVSFLLSPFCLLNCIKIIQGRLGPGRIHHCMRSVGEFLFPMLCLHELMSVALF